MLNPFPLPNRTDVARAAIRSWQGRALMWRNVHNVKILKDFDLVHVPGTMDFCARGMSMIVSNHSYAKSVEASPHLLASARERWARSLEVSYDDQGMAARYHSFLEDYMAAIDHDFFSGLITRPVCVGDGTIMATDHIVKLEVIHGPRPLTFKGMGLIPSPPGARFDHQRKVITVWTKHFDLPENLRRRFWTKPAFEAAAVDFRQYIVDRDVDAVIMSLVEEMVHVFLRIGSSYKQNSELDAELRERELLDPHGHGFGTAHYHTLAFIARHLDQSKTSTVFETAAITSEQNAEHWEQHWMQYDELKDLGADDLPDAPEPGMCKKALTKAQPVFWAAAMLFSLGFLAYNLLSDANMFYLDWHNRYLHVGLGQLKGSSWINFLRSPIPNAAIFLWLFELILEVCTDRGRGRPFVMFQELFQQFMMAFAVCGLMQSTLLGPVSFHNLSSRQTHAFAVLAAGLHMYRSSR